MKTHKIVPGNSGKQNVEYYEDDTIVLVELWSQPGFQNTLRKGFEQLKDGPKWSAMYEALRANTALELKMLSVTVMSGHLAAVYSVLQRGVDGFPNEASLSYLLNRPGWNWTTNEKNQMNSYFTTNSFSITVT